MKGIPRPQAFAVLFLLTLFWAAPASSSDWSKTIKDILKGKQKTEQQPPARFKDKEDGTLTDSRTGLTWLKNANCGTFFEGDKNGGRNSRSWQDAKVAVSKLADGFCGLKDGSKAGDWRLPNREELLAIAHDVSKKEKWQAEEAFSGIQSVYYWSSTTGDLYQDYAFYVSMMYGIDSYAFRLNSFHVLAVKGTMKPQQQ